MQYKVAGRYEEQPVDVLLGWDEPTKLYYFEATQGHRELSFGVELSFPELIDKTRGYVTWDRKLFYALRDAPIATHVKNNPNDPVSKIVASVR